MGDGLLFSFCNVDVPVSKLRVQGRSPARFNGGYGVLRGFKGEKSKSPPNPLSPAERVSLKASTRNNNRQFVEKHRLPAMYPQQIKLKKRKRLSSRAEHFKKQISKHFWIWGFAPSPHQRAFRSPFGNLRAQILGFTLEISVLSA